MTSNYIADCYTDLQSLAAEYKGIYAAGHPYPHIQFDNFFKPKVLHDILAEFPELGGKGDIKFNNPNEVKLASKGEHRFGPKTLLFMHYLNSQPFLEFLQGLTDVEEVLLPDPYFEGGGLHQTKRGGFLKMHADFNKHYETKLDRRLNVLVYLNEDWDEAWGGHFELWDREMKGCVKKIAPVFNRLVCFTTTNFSYHGLPDPIQCPEDRSRKSLALYYYTNGRPAHEVVEGIEEHNTLFQARKEDADAAKYMARQRVKSFVKDLVPPIFLKIGRRMMGGSTN